MFSNVLLKYIYIPLVIILASCCVANFEDTNAGKSKINQQKEPSPGALLYPPLNDYSDDQFVNISSHYTASSLFVSKVSDSSSLDSNLSEKCPSKLECKDLGVDCLNCTLDDQCPYGKNVSVSCKVKIDVQCRGSRTFNRTMRCAYCYQTRSFEHTCQQNTSCRVVSAPRQRFISKCVTHSNVLCLGNRIFAKNLLCNWTKGISWNTALISSLILGGFGVDRFYLGMWQEGIGKLFSFGGLGVWTLVDVILIATGYLGPADGSLFIR